MRIFDCTTYYKEDLMLEARFNILDKYVDKFLVSEAKFSHSGEKKKLNFNIKKFPDFKNKIIYTVIENEPSNLIYENKNNKIFETKDQMRNNSIKRIAFQRDKLLESINIADDEDYIFYSDNDEIPNFKNVNLENNTNKIIIFKQKLFYYKFNLSYDAVDWYGTKGCKKKNLKSFGWLREIKAKKYPFYRIDTLFKKNKYMKVEIINDGGWHFSQLKSPKDLEIKFMNQEHHDEYKQSRDQTSDIEDLIKRKVINYDYKAKKTDYKFSKEFKLKVSPIETMPRYLRENISKYSEWFDLEK